MIKRDPTVSKRIMKISFLVYMGLIAFTGVLPAAPVKGQAARQRADVVLQQPHTLDKVMETLRQRYGASIYYDPQVLKQYTAKEGVWRQATLEDVLHDVLPPAGLSYTMNSNNVIVSSRQQATGKISGHITDSEGNALPGASIQVIETGKGVTANADGDFELNLPPGVYTLQVRYVSYVAKKLEQVRVEAGKTNQLSIQLAKDANKLNEVVITALNLKRDARSLTFSQQGVDVAALNEAKSSNLVNGLSGKIAGVQIVPAGFNTGSSRIVIRGNNSITGNNQPLFVIDGMPIDNEPGDDGALDYGNSAGAINTEDIESIQVLKGPNASALYGSRAANGVVLITTRRGSSGFNVTFNSSVMAQTLTEFPEYQNAYGVGTSFYIDRTNALPVGAVNYRSWGSPMLGQPYVALNGQVKPYLPHPDNVKDFYSTAHLITNALALEGGNAKNLYRFSYTNLNGSSVVKGFNENTRHSFDLRLQQQPKDWLKFDTKINFVRNIVDNRQYSNANGRNPANLYTAMARSTDLSELHPYIDPVTGKEIGTHRNFSNPYWVINENPNHDVKDWLLVTFNPEVQIRPWLKFIARAGADVYWWEGFEFNNIGSVIASNPNGYMRTFNTRQISLNTEGLLSANKQFGNFNLSGILGASRYSLNYEKRGQEISSLLQPGLINLSNTNAYPTVSQSARKKEIQSVYGSVSLGYRNFAFLDLTGRNDWSSTLPRANNSYFYPSVGGALVLNDMLGLKSNLLNYAKVRASYAIVGNDTDPYRLTNTFSFNGLLNGAPLASLSTTMNNPDLKPEKTTSLEFGTDLRLFRNRISLSATYYTAATTNQIITAQLPSSSGYQSRLYNAGKIKNWGVELTGSATVMRAGKFSWETNLNFSKNNSRVVSLLDGISRFQLNGNGGYIYVYAEVGKPYAYLRGLGVASDAQGRMLMDDGGGLLTKNNDMPFGTATPDWLGGINNTFSYGNFNLSVLFDFKMGGVVYSGTMSRMLVNGVAAETLYGRDDYYKHSVIYGESDAELTGGARWDAVFADGKPNTEYMSPQSYEYARPNYAEFVMYDASYIKLREIMLGYTLPLGLLRRTPIKSARLSLMGRNLAILYRRTPKGIDPEASSTSGNGQGIENGSLPPNAIYGFNIRLTL